jgi:hypothetical protein
MVLGGEFLEPMGNQHGRDQCAAGENGLHPRLDTQQGKSGHGNADEQKADKGAGDVELPWADGRGTEIGSCCPSSNDLERLA